MATLIARGDALRLPLPDGSVDAICTDPPYGLEFMGKDWDAPWRTGDGFRRSRNPADVDRANTFGRMSKRAPEYFAGRAYQAWCEQWATEALRVLKPGGWLLAFGGTRTWHRLACGIEDAGFEMRDTKAEFSPAYGPLAWLYGSGFPKSLDVDRAIDMELCQQPGRHFARTLTPEDKRQPDDHVCPDTPEGTAWAGFGTAAKPSWEPIIVARKPLAGSVAQNVLTYGTGALNIDATRITATDKAKFPEGYSKATGGTYAQDGYSKSWVSTADRDPSGRWPPNVALVHDPGCVPVGVRKVRGSHPVQPGGGKRDEAYPHNNRVYGKFTAVAPHDYTDPDGTETITAWECQPGCPVFLLDQQSGERPTGKLTRKQPAVGWNGHKEWRDCDYGGDQGGASRFYPTFQTESRLFYTAKAPRNERVTIDGEGHPTVKPLDLMRWLVRLVTPPGGLILDPFGGSGTTGEAAMLEGFHAIVLDKDPASCAKAKIRTHPTIRRTLVTTDPDTGELIEDQPRLW